MIGRTILHYEIVAELGSGSVGHVFLARDVWTHRMVALKFLDPAKSDSEGRARLVREARVAARLSHPGIVTLYGLEEENGESFLVEEYIHGETLAQRLQRGCLGTEETLRMSRELCEALKHAHDHGVLHRDLKPANILVADDGSYKIADFGIAKVDDALTSTAAGSLVGTIPYMSPERLRGHAGDTRSDFYSLGVVMYEAMTSHRPFRGVTEEEILYQVLNEEPKPMEVGSARLRPLATIVLRLLSKDPRARPDSTELLGGLLQDSDLRVRARSSKARPRVIGAFVAVSLVGLGIVLWRATINPGDSPVASVAVFPFENVSDPIDSGRFGAIASNLLVWRLAESSPAHVVSSERILDALYEIGRGGTVPDRALARRVASRLQAGWIVTGSILRTTPNVLVTAEISDASRGQVFDATRLDGRPGQALVDVLDSLGTYLALRLPVQAEDSLDGSGRVGSSRDLIAIRLYVQGLDYVAAGYQVKAEIAFQNALHRDPGFREARQQLALLAWRKSHGAREAP
jgi:serine/threonine protein kinase